MKKETRSLYFKEEGEETLMMIMMMMIVMMMMMIVVMMNEWSGKNKETKYINDHIHVSIN